MSKQRIIVLCSKVIRTNHLIHHILYDIRTIVLVWNHTVWQFIMQSSAFLIGTFQAVNGKPAFLSTCFFMYTQLPVPPA